MGTEQGTAIGPSNLFPGYRLLRVKGPRPTVVLIAGPGHAFFVHWDESLRRTQACVFHRCGYCANSVPRRPLSYFPVYTFGDYQNGVTWRRAVLEVPFRTGLWLANMRARSVSLRRRSSCGIVDITPIELRSRPEEAQAWDIVPQLQALWRLPRSAQLSLVTEDMVQ